MIGEGFTGDERRFLIAAYQQNNGGTFDWSNVGKQMRIDHRDAADLMQILSQKSVLHMGGFQMANFTPTGRQTAQELREHDRLKKLEEAGGHPGVPMRPVSDQQREVWRLEQEAENQRRTENILVACYDTSLEAGSKYFDMNLAAQKAGFEGKDTIAPEIHALHQAGFIRLFTRRDGEMMPEGVAEVKRIRSLRAPHTPARDESPQSREAAASVLPRMHDIFDQASDMVVLPCSAKGTFSRAVRRDVERFGIPVPPKQELGGVTIVEFPGSGTITRRIAWAASVLDDQTTAEAIERIGRSLGDATRRDSTVRLIATPLLGTGHGRLENKSAAAALCKGFLSGAAVGSVLSICSVTKSVVDDAQAGLEILRGQRGSNSSTNEAAKLAKDTATHTANPLWRFLTESVKYVPFNKNAVGLVGIAGGAALILSFFKDWQTALIAVVVLMALMIALVILGRIKDQTTKGTHHAAAVLIWFVVFMFCATVLMLWTRYFFNWPPIHVGPAQPSGQVASQLEAAIVKAREAGDERRLFDLLRSRQLQDEQSGLAGTSHYVADARELAAIAMRRSDTSEAAPQLQRIINLFPGDPEALLRLGVVRIDEGRFPDAIKHLEEAINRNPNDTKTKCQAHNSLGSIYLKQGNAWGNCEYHFGEALKLADDPQIVSDIHENLGMMYLQKDEWDKAKAEFKYVEKKSLEAQLLLVRLTEHEQGRTAAIAELQAIITLLQKDSALYDTARGNLGLLLVEDGQYQQAFPVLTESVGRARNMGRNLPLVQSLSNIADLFRRMKMYDNAQDALSEARAIAVDRGFESNRIDIDKRLAALQLERSVRPSTTQHS